MTRVTPAWLGTSVQRGLRSRTEGYNCDIHRRSWDLTWQIRDQAGMKVISNDADMICQVLNLNNTSTPSLSLLMNIGLVQVTGSWWHTHHTCCQDQLWVTGQCHQICHQGMTCDNGGLHPVTSYWGWCDDWTKMLGLIPHNKKKIQSTASKFFLAAKQHIESVWKVPTILPKLLPTRLSLHVADTFKQQLESIVLAKVSAKRSTFFL